jgi:hypothetical protein
LSYEKEESLGTPLLTPSPRTYRDNNGEVNREASKLMRRLDAEEFLRRKFRYEWVTVTKEIDEDV